MPGGRWQLVAFTILTQLAVGLMVMLAVGLRLTTGRLDPQELAGLTTAVLEIVIVLLLLGAVAATTHLGSATSATRAFANLRTSWLSREVSAGGLFGLLTIVATLAYRLGLGSPAGRWWCVVVAAVAGVVLVYAMAKLYMLRTVPAWNTWTTPVSFMTTTVLLGVAGSAAALLALGRPFAAADRLLTGMMPWTGWCCLLLAGVQLALSVCRSLLTPKGGHVTSRHLGVVSAVTGLGGAALFLVAAYSLHHGLPSGPPTGVWIAVASALLVASEVVGRIRFYASFDRCGV